MSKNNYLQYAIQNSYKEFLDNNFNNEENLQNWLGHSLSVFYTNNSAEGFSSNSKNLLENNVNKEDVLEFLLGNYIEKIETTPEEEITDYLQKVVKTKMKVSDKNAAKLAIQKYILESDTTNLDVIDDEKIKQYSANGLINVMSLIAVKQSVSMPIIELEQSENLNNKTSFSVSDFSVIANKNKERNIDDIIDIMETIRSGKIKEDAVR